MKQSDVGDYEKAQTGYLRAMSKSSAFIATPDLAEEQEVHLIWQDSEQIRRMWRVPSCEGVLLVWRLNWLRRQLLVARGAAGRRHWLVWGAAYSASKFRSLGA